MDRPGLPGARTLTLEEEAAMLARYSTMQRREYLFEVAFSRGGEVANRLHELVSEIVKQREPGRC